MSRRKRSRAERLDAVAEMILSELEGVLRWSTQAENEVKQLNAAAAIWHLASAYDLTCKHLALEKSGGWMNP